MKSLILGRDIVTDDLVSIEQEQRLKGFYVIGKTGSGKTTLLVNLILQDIENGLGVCFFDTHGDAITDILRRFPANRREDDVLLLDLIDNDYAFGLNLFQCYNPQDKQEVSRVTSFIMQVFAKLFTESGDLVKEATYMTEILQNTIPVFLAHQHPHMTMAEIPLLLMNDTARTRLLASLRNPIIKSYWESFRTWKSDEQKEVIASTRRRVNNFLSDPLIFEIIGQSETTFDFRKIMDEQKILLVKLSRQHELITSLIGSVIVAQLANAAYSRASIPEDQRVQFNLYADEYQRFCTPTFAELLTEVRKFKVATCVAHQSRGQLDYKNRVATLNAGNLVVYEVSGEDAEELAGQFKITPQEAWEEEIEEEWVEVLKEEWHERIEEVVIDGEEEIKTSVTDVVGYLLGAKGSHPNLVVNRYATTILPNIQQVVKDKSWYEEILSCINNLLYSAMVNKDIYQPFPSNMVQLLLYSYSAYILTDASRSLLIRPLVRGDWEKVHRDWEKVSRSEKEQKKTQELHNLAGMIKTIEINRRSEEDNRKNQEYYLTVQRKHPYDKRFEIPYEPIGVTDWKHVYQYYVRNETHDRYLRPWYHLPENPDMIVWEKVDAEQCVIAQSHWRTWYREEDLDCYVNEQWQQQAGFVSQCFDILQELREVMQALADKPIASGSGQYQPHTRTQITYLTHPRETITHPRIAIMHPQRTYTDMEHEIANNLASPAKPFTARAKIGTNEYTIQALPFRPPDADCIWLARQKRIIEQTHDLYCKKREDVDVEILARHNALTKKEPPKPRTTSDDDEE